MKYPTGTSTHIQTNTKIHMFQTQPWTSTMQALTAHGYKFEFLNCDQLTDSGIQLAICSQIADINYSSRTKVLWPSLQKKTPIAQKMHCIYLIHSNCKTLIHSYCMHSNCKTLHMPHTLQLHCIHKKPDNVDAHHQLSSCGCLTRKMICCCRICTCHQNSGLSRDGNCFPKHNQRADWAEAFDGPFHMPCDQQNFRWIPNFLR